MDIRGQGYSPDYAESDIDYGPQSGDGTQYSGYGRPAQERPAERRPDGEYGPYQRPQAPASDPFAPYGNPASARTGYVPEQWDPQAQVQPEARIPAGETYQPRRARHARPAADPYLTAPVAAPSFAPAPSFPEQRTQQFPARQPYVEERGYGDDYGRGQGGDQGRDQSRGQNWDRGQDRDRGRDQDWDRIPEREPEQFEELPRPGRTRTGEPAEPAKRKRRRSPLVVTGVLVFAGVTVVALDAAGLIPGTHDKPSAAANTGPLAPTSAPAAAPSAAASSSAPSPTPTSSATGASNFYPALPGIGTVYGSQIPASTTQVVVAYGAGLTQYTTTVEFFQKVSGGWQLQDTWAGHNGDDGWVTVANRVGGDLRSPIGVFTLTDAGGKLPAPPGTKLPYQQSSEYVDYGKGFFGESLLDAFNYVIAINFNHEAGTSPMSTYYPMGPAVGGGVWLHVDHGGPTHACVSIPQDGVETLLEDLNPADNPVIVMGDKNDLASN